MHSIPSASFNAYRSAFVELKARIPDGIPDGSYTCNCLPTPLLNAVSVTHVNLEGA